MQEASFGVVEADEITVDCQAKIRSLSRTRALHQLLCRQRHVSTRGLHAHACWVMLPCVGLLCVWLSSTFHEAG